MQISLKWINELVNIEAINLDNLIEKLTLGGFEVENILEVKIGKKNQIALDISATANRSDSLSMQGISTEIATLLNQESKSLSYARKIENWKEQINQRGTIIDEKEDYSIFIGLIVENVPNILIPTWMKEKLISSGITPENNLSDFQNYILLETGYPIAVYDYEKICCHLDTSSFDLSIQTAEENQEFLAKNGNNYYLDKTTLLVKANEIPLSIGGIIEHANFSVTPATTSLLIEASIFNPAKIRQQSRALGLRTDRSARYEKSLKNTYLIEALHRFVSLLRISNPTLNCRFHTAKKSREKIAEPISLHYQTICEILGPVKESTLNHLQYIEPSQITKYLKRLNFEATYETSNISWAVQIPHARSEDITREIDLIEEIGRLHGFNNFFTALPQLKAIGKKDWSYQTRKKMTSCLLNLGLTEFIHYSLIHEKKLIHHKVPLVNPLVSDYSNLRSSLLPSLLTTVEENLKQGQLGMEGFEYGHIFLEDPIKKFQEKEYVAGIFGGFKNKQNWSSSAQSLHWFEAKGKMEQLFSQLNVLPDWVPNASEEMTTIFHPYRSAELYFQNGKRVGIFGQIHPLLANQLGLLPELYLFELDLDHIQKEIQKNEITVYQDYSFYPKIVKDLSFIIEQNITFEELQKLLYCNGTQFLTEIKLLDEYQGSSIPENYRSLCFQLIFQSNEKTLQNKEIENIIQNLQTVLENKFSAKIRE